MFECKGCQAKQRDIEYLRTLVDRLLADKGIAPVEVVEEEVKPEEPTKGERYGD